MAGTVSGLSRADGCPCRDACLGMGRHPQVADRDGAGAVRRIEAWLPRLLPGAHLSPNGDQKRVPALVAADKRQMRGDVCLGLLALDQVRESTTPFQRAHVLTELRWCKRWRWRSVYLPDDPSNAAYALKAAVDGIVDAGLLPDDSGVFVRVLSTSVTRVATREEEGLLIVISDLGDD